MEGIAKTTVALTKPERKKLASLETVIESKRQAFFEMGSALLEIRESRLYRGTFDTFEEYCRERWDLTRQYSNRLIAATEVRKNLETIVSILPENEGQSKELGRLPADDQPKAWQIVIDRAPEIDGAKHITAKLVESVVKEFRGEQEDVAEPEDVEHSGIALDEALGDISEFVRSIVRRLPADLHEVVAGKLRGLADEIEEGLNDVH